jgi:LacI family transcriptional regulator
MITLRDIAREAGVSATTVSNVIKGADKKVSRKTADAISAILERENYIPSMAARVLAGSSSKIICALHLPPYSSLYGDGAFLAAMEARVRERGYFLMIRQVSGGKDIEEVCGNWNIDGIIFTGEIDDESLRALTRQGIPYILTDSGLDGRDAWIAGFADEEGGFIAAKHLLDRGHRRVAFASAPIGSSTVLRLRLEGFKRALAESGASDFAFFESMPNEAGVNFGFRLLKKVGASGIVASTDLLAAELLSSFCHAGARVPDDISIVAFGGGYICALTNPRLTCVRQDCAAKGGRAAETLLGRLSGRKSDGGPNMPPIPVLLVEGGSVQDV